MAWEEWFQVEPTGQKFMTGPTAMRFLQAHPDRCHISDEESGLPDVVILDRPYKLRVVREADLHWLEIVRMKDLVSWPPTFGAAYEPRERDPQIYEVKVDGGEVIRLDGVTPYLRILGSYERKQLTTDVPCGPELLARLAAETLKSLRGRLVMEIADEEIMGDAPNRRRRVPRRSASGRLRPDGR